MAHLFRPEALAARGDRRFGNVSLAQPLALSVLAGVSALFVGALVAVGLFGEYRHKTLVPGRVETTRANIALYPTRPGVVMRVMVIDQQPVIRGQPVARIDDSGAIGRTGNRRLRTLSALESRAALIDEQIRQQASSVLVRRRKLKSAWSHAHARLVGLRRERPLHEARVGLTEGQAHRITMLADRGVVPRSDADLALLRVLDARLAAGRAQRERTVLAAQIAALKLELEALPAESASGRLELQRARRGIEQHMIDVEHRSGGVLHATADGRITGLRLRAGQHVDGGAPVLWIVPERAEYYVELEVPTRAIGSVRYNAPVTLRFDAFPHRKYGTHTGRITAIARRAVPGHGVEPVFPVRVTINRPLPADLALSPGMTLTASIVQEARTIFAWLIDPLRAMARRVGA